MSIFGSELMPTGKYVAHHPDAEIINNDSGDDIENALEIAYDEDEEETFQNGNRIAISEICDWLPTVDDGNRIIEDLQEVAYEECGEVTEGFLSHVKPRQVDDLAHRVQSVVREWLKEIYPEHSPFWRVGNTVYQTVSLPPEIVEKRALREQETETDTR